MEHLTRHQDGHSGAHTMLPNKNMMRVFFFLSELGHDGQNPEVPVELTQFPTHFMNALMSSAPNDGRHAAEFVEEHHHLLSFSCHNSHKCRCHHHNMLRMTVATPENELETTPSDGKSTHEQQILGVKELHCLFLPSCCRHPHACHLAAVYLEQDSLCPDTVFLWSCCGQCSHKLQSTLLAQSQTKRVLLKSSPGGQLTWLSGRGAPPTQCTNPAHSSAGSRGCPEEQSPPGEDVAGAATEGDDVTATGDSALLAPVGAVVGEGDALTMAHCTLKSQSQICPIPSNKSPSAHFFSLPALDLCRDICGRTVFPSVTRDSH